MRLLLFKYCPFVLHVFCSPASRRQMPHSAITAPRPRGSRPACSPRHAARAVQALYRASRKPRQLAYQQLRLLVVQGKRHGLSEDAALAMDATIVKGVSDAGTCVRIKFQVRCGQALMTCAEGGAPCCSQGAASSAPAAPACNDMVTHVALLSVQALPQTLTLVSTGFLQIWVRSRKRLHASSAQCPKGRAKPVLIPACHSPHAITAKPPSCLTTSHPCSCCWCRWACKGSGWSWLQCSSPPCYCSVWMRRPHR